MENKPLVIEEGSYLETVIMGLRNKCVECGRDITLWMRFKRLFWGPTFCDKSFVYKACCSPSCWEKALEKRLKKIKGGQRWELGIGFG